MHPYIFTCMIGIFVTLASSDIAVAQGSPTEEARTLHDPPADRCHRFPYLVSIILPSKQPICAGTLIAPEFIVTAANCFSWPTAKESFVVGGEPNLFDKSYNFVGQVRKVAQIKIHPLYKKRGRSSKEHDIAVAKVHSPFELGMNKMAIVGLATDNRILKQSVVSPGYGISLAYELANKDPYSAYRIRYALLVRERDPMMCHSLNAESVYCAMPLEVGQYMGDIGAPHIFAPGYVDVIYGVVSGPDQYCSLCRIIVNVTLNRKWIIEQFHEHGDAETVSEQQKTPICDKSPVVVVVVGEAWSDVSRFLILILIVLLIDSIDR